MINKLTFFSKTLLLVGGLATIHTYSYFYLDELITRMQLHLKDKTEDVSQFENRITGEIDRAKRKSVTYYQLRRDLSQSEQELERLHSPKPPLKGSPELVLDGEWELVPDEVECNQLQEALEQAEARKKEKEAQLSDDIEEEKKSIQEQIRSLKRSDSEISRLLKEHRELVDAQHTMAGQVMILKQLEEFQWVDELTEDSQITLGELVLSSRHEKNMREFAEACLSLHDNREAAEQFETLCQHGAIRGEEKQHLEAQLRRNSTEMKEEIDLADADIITALQKELPKRIKKGRRLSSGRSPILAT